MSNIDCPTACQGFACKPRVGRSVWAPLGVCYAKACRLADHGQIQPAFTRPGEPLSAIGPRIMASGTVASPFLVGGICCKVTVQQVRRDSERVIAVGGHLVFAPLSSFANKRRTRADNTCKAGVRGAFGAQRTAWCIQSVIATSRLIYRLEF